MKLEDIHIGMKVVPHDKTDSSYPGLNGSMVWTRFERQGFLYVIRINDCEEEDGYEISLGGKSHHKSGDWFMASDVTEYIETKEDSMLEEIKVGDKVKVISKSVGDMHYLKEDKGKELFVTKIGDVGISDDDTQPPKGEPVYTVDIINPGSSGNYYLRKDLVLIKETKQEEQEMKQTFPPQGKVFVNTEFSPTGDSFVVYIVGDIHKRLINVRLDSKGIISSITEENGYPFEFNRDSQEERISSLKDMIDTVIDRVIELDEESTASNRNTKLIKEMLSQYTGE